ncbi:PREDICTED: uncharacterized protein LOC104789069 [Camelina sativa]|uniref:Uncharacterized protein LOC104789069 n=1 Tax=Camelina sativa TaxID=90675 RepID=A0ABM0ZB80_CAMSA|nr:PREDICTED: uncharacterized protein LOC104789069 [Camelina sativa]
MVMDKTWVHLNRTDPGYEKGAWDFVRSVAAGLGDNSIIICPCIDCRNVYRHSAADVVDHLVTRGMDWSYKSRDDWFHHGEVKSRTECRKNTSQWNEEILGLFKAAEFMDEELVSHGDLIDVDEGDDKVEDEFLAKLADAEAPLYPGCTNYNKLSAIVSLFRLKTQSGWSDKSFDSLLETLKQMLPKDNVLHTSLYEVKKFFKSFDMGYEKIHACVNDCCLFRNQYEELDSCPKCKSSRWKINKRTGEVKKGTPQKVLRYFPIIPRLKRMFRSEDTAKDLRWHFNNKSTDGKMRHPVDSVTWDQMNEKYPSFAAEERNIRLGLSTDGFNPFNMKNVNYSAWPVLLVNYNMPPDKCMKEENIMLTLLIPGPTQPGNNIDVYLEPLIEDLNHLWEKGEDFPVYGNLAGCKVKGIMGCPVCGKHTDINGRKRKMQDRVGSASYIDDESSESEEEEEQVDEEELSRWKKRSIFFKLEYWKEMLVMHNLDVMHVERNVAASLVSTMLHSAKSKDGVNARKDMQLLGIRKDLHPQARGKRTYLPPGPWSLSKTEKKVFCKRLSDFRGPDGYCSNISRCVKIEDCTVKGLLPKGVRIAIGRLCAFFNKLCQRVIDREAISVMEHEVVETICMFERFFPPSFFDIMVHLTVHLGREVRLCGPVHFRWMYPFERYMKVLKDFVRNMARPEGCIAESYLAEECMRFCSDFLKNTTNADEKMERNADYENCSILEGRPISAPTSCTLTENEKNIAHLAVIHNMALIDPYVDMHLQHLQDSSERCRRDSVFLWRTHFQKFASWLKEQIPMTSDHEDALKWLAYGPRLCARSYTGYIVNGNRFHTVSVDIGKLKTVSGGYYTA